MILLLILMLGAAPQVHWLDMLEKARDDEEAAQKMLKMLNKLEHPTPTELAYKGSVQLLLANHAFWPNAKYSYFKEGAQNLDEAARQEPDNCQIRYLRLACQVNAPSLLGYNEHIEKDKAFLHEHYTRLQDLYLKKKIEVLIDL